MKHIVATYLLTLTALAPYAHVHARILHTAPSFRANTQHFGIPTMTLGHKGSGTLRDILKDLHVDWENATLFMVYMAAYNDLREFAIENLGQMRAVGSNKNLLTVVHLDIKIHPNKKVTRWYLVLNDGLVHLNATIPGTQAMDSGNPKTLLTFCHYCAQQFPANYVALDLWNHGTGYIDPKTGRMLEASDLFTFNPETHLLELNRSESFLDNIEMLHNQDRGICWDDYTGHYLTNHDLLHCFKSIKEDVYHGKKLDWVGFDACLMSMLEIASLFKDYAEIMVGSQEVILGPGWHYQRVLFPFLHGPLNPEEFARHTVQMYELTYKGITQDYTLCALQLSHTEQLERAIDQLGNILLKLLQHNDKKAVKRAIRQAKAKQNCTYFDERSYKDLDHFLGNLYAELNAIQSSNEITQKNIKQAKKQIQESQNAIRRMVIANVNGKRLPKAHGISIYFPERRMHESYAKSPFGKTNSWKSVIRQYLIS